MGNIFIGRKFNSKNKQLIYPHTLHCIRKIKYKCLLNFKRILTVGPISYIRRLIMGQPLFEEKMSCVMWYMISHYKNENNKNNNSSLF